MDAGRDVPEGELDVGAIDAPGIDAPGIDAPGSDGGGVAVPYPWYPELDVTSIPFGTSGAWGAGLPLEAPAAPVVTRDVTVTTAAELSAEATSGTRITVGADIDAVVDIRANDVEVIVPRGRFVRTIVLAGFPFDRIARIRIRGETIGVHSGGLVGKIWSLGPVDDLIVDGLDLNGDNAADVQQGQGIQSGDGPNARWAIVHNRGNFRGWAFLGGAAHLVFAGNNFLHGRGSREENGYVEGWGIRAGGGPLVLFQNRIEGTRYHAIRAQPGGGEGEYLYAAENTIVSLNEARIGWIWANLGNGMRADGTWFSRNDVYTHVAATCGLGVSLEAFDVEYSRVNGNRFFGGGDSVLSEASLAAQISTYTGDHDWSGNTFEALGPLPAWGGPGDPTTIPLVGGITPSTGSAECPPP